MNEQVLAEIYANAIAQGVNPLYVSDNPFSDEWKRQVGYYGHNPIIDDRTPLATADYRPDFRFLDQWWRKYKPPVVEEEELEEEKPVEKVLEEIISEGGGDRVAPDGFVDMRDPAFMGRSGYPGMKDGQWLGGNLGWKDAAQMLGNMRGGIGGLLSGMLNGSLSTYGSPSGKNAIGNIADALGVNKDTALAEIGKALGYSDPATAAAKKDTSLVGQLTNALFGGKPGTPNVKGMMAGTLAGYPNTWDNPTFNNIVNERATIAGVLNALATPDFDWGLAGAKGNWSNPSAISGFVNMANKLGVDLVGMQNKDQLGMWNTIAELMGATAAYNPKVNGFLQALYEMNGSPMAERASKGALDSSELGLMASSAIGNPWGGLRDEMKSGKFDNFDKVARDYLDAKDRLGKINEAVEKSRSGEGGDGIGGTGYGPGGSRGDVGDFDGTGGTEAEHEANDPEAKNA